MIGAVSLEVGNGVGGQVTDRLGYQETPNVSVDITKNEAGVKCTGRQ